MYLVGGWVYFSNMVVYGTGIFPALLNFKIELKIFSFVSVPLVLIGRTTMFVSKEIVQKIKINLEGLGKWLCIQINST